MNLVGFGWPSAQGVVTYPAGASFGPRQMRDHEFVWIIEGSALYRQNGRSFDAPAGSVVLCRPNTEDGFLWSQERTTTHGFFHFALNATPNFLPPASEWEAVRLPQEGSVLFPLLFHVLSLGGGDAPPSVLRRDQGRLVLAALLTAFVSGQTGTRHLLSPPLPPPVERAWNYLQRKLAHSPEAPLTLPELASAACVSEEHLCRLFRGAVGVSPMQAVKQVRLDRAVSLLTRSNYSVAEVASLCGFDDPLYFSETFKKTFALTPSELRRRVGEGMTPPTPVLFREGRLFRA